MSKTKGEIVDNSKPNEINTLADRSWVETKLSLWERDFRHMPVYEFLGLDMIDLYKLQQRKKNNP